MYINTHIHAYLNLVDILQETLRNNSYIAGTADSSVIVIISRK